MKHQAFYGGFVLLCVTGIGMAQSVTIDNGVLGDGHLRIDVDGYGAYTNWGWAENHDYYDPAGPLLEGSPTFAASFMLYVAGVERVALAEPSFNIDSTYNTSGGPRVTASNPLVNGAGDTATSAWSSIDFAGGLAFDFELSQTVSTGAASSAFLTQQLSITNTGSAPVSLELQRQLDLDIAWDGSSEDVAGSVECNGVIQPYMRDPDGDRHSPTLVSMTSPDPFEYVSGKSGFDNGGGTFMAYGTDFQIWDDYGYPRGWRNYTAGVGSAPVVGELPGAKPAGSSSPYDAFINIEWSLHLEPGETKTITSVTQYGTDCVEAGCPCACNVDTSTGPDVCDTLDFLAFQSSFVGGESCACNIDVSTGSNVCDIFDFLSFQNEFVGGCK